MTESPSFAEIGRKMTVRSRERMRRVVETALLREGVHPLVVSDGGRSETPRLSFVACGPPPRGTSFDCGLPVLGDSAYALRDRDAS